MCHHFAAVVDADFGLRAVHVDTLDPEISERSAASCGTRVSRRDGLNSVDQLEYESKCLCVSLYRNILDCVCWGLLGRVSRISHRV